MHSPLTHTQVAETFALLKPLFEAHLPVLNRQGAAFSVAYRGADGTVIPLGDFVAGDLSQNPYPNGEIAQQKRDLSLRTGLSGANVPKSWLQESDSPWTGSTFLDGFAVGVAGLTEEQDEMFSSWLAAALRATLRQIPR